MTEKKYSVELRRANSLVTPFGVRLVKGRSETVKESSPHLAYYRARSKDFSVREVSLPSERAKVVISAAEMTVATSSRRLASRAANNTKPAPPPPEPEVEEEGEDSGEYTEPQLKRLRRANLVEIAGTFDLSVEEGDTRPDIIDKILKAQEDRG